MVVFVVVVGYPPQFAEEVHRFLLFILFSYISVSRDAITRSHDMKIIVQCKSDLINVNITLFRRE